MVSLGMTVVNLITGYRLLMYATLFFTIANVINEALALCSRKA